MPTYKIPLVWECYGHVYVTEDTKEKAIEYAIGPDCPLPQGDYVDGSCELDEDLDVEEV